LFKKISKLSQEDKLDFEKILNLKKQMHWGLAEYGKTVCSVGNQVASKEVKKEMPVKPTELCIDEALRRRTFV
jgi:hypothetical protein